MSESNPPEANPPRILVLACGALARELLDLIEVNGWRHVTLECLPGILHNRPERIPEAVEARLAQVAGDYDHIMVGYADCGTGGKLDSVVAAYGAAMLPGDHCYEFYATTPVFARLSAEELGTFYLTDYLAKHFDRIVWRGLALDRHPELRDAYFAHYTRLVYLSQTATLELVERASAAADRLGLRFEHRPVGYGDLERTAVEFVAQPIDVAGVR